MESSGRQRDTARAMSQENMELVRAAYAAFARGDLAYILDLSDADIEIVEQAEMPGARTYHGHQGVLDALDNWVGAWEDFRFDIERMVSVGDRVVALVHHQARGKVSGAPVEVRIAYVHTIKNGKGVRWEMFTTWDEALEAAGLRE